MNSFLYNGNIYLKEKLNCAEFGVQIEKAFM